MRVFTKVLLAGALVIATAAPALADPPNYRGSEHRYERSERDAYRDGREDGRRADERRDYRDWNHRQWYRGDRFDRRVHYVVVNDYYRYHLRPPPRGHYYYRTDAGQILLVAAATGLIVSAFAS